eukprot:g5067.t1
MEMEEDTEEKANLSPKPPTSTPPPINNESPPPPSPPSEKEGEHENTPPPSTPPPPDTTHSEEKEKTETKIVPNIDDDDVESIEEKRQDAGDGEFYTKEEFFECYGGYEEWDAAGKVKTGEVENNIDSVEVEKRIDPSDGIAYTKEEFLNCYGDLEIWNTAKPLALHKSDEERRIDPQDHQPYTKEEFQQCYGGLNEWNSAKIYQEKKNSADENISSEEKSIITDTIDQGNDKSEVRLDPLSGAMFTEKEFVEFYGGDLEWKEAKEINKLKLEYEHLQNEAKKVKENAENARKKQAAGELKEKETFTSLEKTSITADEFKKVILSLQSECFIDISDKAVASLLITADKTGDGNIPVSDAEEATDAAIEKWLSAKEAKAHMAFEASDHAKQIYTTALQASKARAKAKVASKKVENTKEKHLEKAKRDSTSKDDIALKFDESVEAVQEAHCAANIARQKAEAEEKISVAWKMARANMKAIIHLSVRAKRRHEALKAVEKAERNAESAKNVSNAVLEVAKASLQSEEKQNECYIIRLVHDAIHKNFRLYIDEHNGMIEKSAAEEILHEVLEEVKQESKEIKKEKENCKISQTLEEKDVANIIITNAKKQLSNLLAAMQINGAKGGKVDVDKFKKMLSQTVKDWEREATSHSVTAEANKVDALKKLRCIKHIERMKLKLLNIRETVEKQKAALDIVLEKGEEVSQKEVDVRSKRLNVSKESCKMVEAAVTVAEEELNEIISNSNNNKIVCEKEEDLKVVEELDRLQSTLANAKNKMKIHTRAIQATIALRRHFSNLKKTDEKILNLDDQIDDMLDELDGMKQAILKVNNLLQLKKVEKKAIQMKEVNEESKKEEKSDVNNKLRDDLSNLCMTELGYEGDISNFLDEVLAYAEKNELNEASSEEIYDKYMQHLRNKKSNTTMTSAEDENLNLLREHAGHLSDLTTKKKSVQKPKEIKTQKSIYEEEDKILPAIYNPRGYLVDVSGDALADVVGYDSNNDGNIDYIDLRITKDTTKDKVLNLTLRKEESNKKKGKCPLCFGVGAPIRAGIGHYVKPKHVGFHDWLRVIEVQHQMQATAENRKRRRAVNKLLENARKSLIENDQQIIQMKNNIQELQVKAEKAKTEWENSDLGSPKRRKSGKAFLAAKKAADVASKVLESTITSMQQSEGENIDEMVELGVDIIEKDQSLLQDQKQKEYKCKNFSKCNFSRFNVEEVIEHEEFCIYQKICYPYNQKKDSKDNFWHAINEKKQDKILRHLRYQFQKFQQTVCKENEVNKDKLILFFKSQLSSFFDENELKLSAVESRVFYRTLASQFDKMDDQMLTKFDNIQYPLIEACEEFINFRAKVEKRKKELAGKTVFKKLKEPSLNTEKKKNANYCGVKASFDLYECEYYEQCGVEDASLHIVVNHEFECKFNPENLKNNGSDENRDNCNSLEKQRVQKFLEFKFIELYKLQKKDGENEGKQEIDEIEPMEIRIDESRAHYVADAVKARLDMDGIKLDGSEFRMMKGYLRKKIRATSGGLSFVECVLFTINFKNRIQDFRRRMQKDRKAKSKQIELEHFPFRIRSEIFLKDEVEKREKQRRERVHMRDVREEVFRKMKASVRRNVIPLEVLHGRNGVHESVLSSLLKSRQKIRQRKLSMIDGKAMEKSKEQEKIQLKKKKESNISRVMKMSARQFVKKYGKYPVPEQRNVLDKSSYFEGEKKKVIDRKKVKQKISRSYINHEGKTCFLNSVFGGSKFFSKKLRDITIEVPQQGKKEKSLSVEKKKLSDTISPAKVNIKPIMPEFVGFDADAGKMEGFLNREEEMYSFEGQQWLQRADIVRNANLVATRFAKLQMALHEAAVAPETVTSKSLNCKRLEGISFRGVSVRTMQAALTLAEKALNVTQIVDQNVSSFGALKFGRDWIEQQSDVLMKNLWFELVNTMIKHESAPLYEKIISKQNSDGFYVIDPREEEDFTSNRLSKTLSTLLRHLVKGTKIFLKNCNDIEGNEQAVFVNSALSFIRILTKGYHAQCMSVSYGIVEEMMISLLTSNQSDIEFAATNILLNIFSTALLIISSYTLVPELYHLIKVAEKSFVSFRLRRKVKKGDKEFPTKICLSFLEILRELSKAEFSNFDAYSACAGFNVSWYKVLENFMIRMTQGSESSAKHPASLKSVDEMMKIASTFENCSGTSDNCLYTRHWNSSTLSNLKQTLLDTKAIPALANVIESNQNKIVKLMRGKKVLENDEDENVEINKEVEEKDVKKGDKDAIPQVKEHLSFWELAEEKSRSNIKKASELLRMDCAEKSIRGRTNLAEIFENLSEEKYEITSTSDDQFDVMETEEEADDKEVRISEIERIIEEKRKKKKRALVTSIEEKKLDDFPVINFPVITSVEEKKLDDFPVTNFPVIHKDKSADCNFSSDEVRNVDNLWKVFTRYTTARRIHIESKLYNPTKLNKFSFIRLLEDSHFIRKKNDRYKDRTSRDNGILARRKAFDIWEQFSTKDGQMKFHQFLNAFHAVASMLNSKLLKNVAFQKECKRLVNGPALKLKPNREKLPLYLAFPIPNWRDSPNLYGRVQTNVTKEFFEFYTSIAHINEMSDTFGDSKNTVREKRVMQKTLSWKLYRTLVRDLCLEKCGISHSALEEAFVYGMERIHDAPIEYGLTMRGLSNALLRLTAILSKKRGGKIDPDDDDDQVIAEMKNTFRLLPRKAFSIFNGQR